MLANKRECRPLRSQEDVVLTRQVVRGYAVDIGLTLVDQTRIITAASELARNTVVHGGGGELIIETVGDTGGRQGVRLVFQDRGAGIPDVQRALQDGFTTGTGLGLGLGGARRLVDHFEIRSAPGEGTTVTVVKWK